VFHNPAIIVLVGLFFLLLQRFDTSVFPSIWVNSLFSSWIFLCFYFYGACGNKRGRVFLGLSPPKIPHVCLVPPQSAIPPLTIFYAANSLGHVVCFGERVKTCLAVFLVPKLYQLSQQIGGLGVGALLDPFPELVKSNPASCSIFDVHTLCCRCSTPYPRYGCCAHCFKDLCQVLFFLSPSL